MHTPILDGYADREPQRHRGHNRDLLESREVVCHVTIRLAVGVFLYGDDHASILHGYGDTGSQKFRSCKLGLLGARDVIGHVNIGLDVVTY